MTPPLVPGGLIHSWTFAADGSRMFYVASQVTADTVEVFDVPLDGSQAARPLSAPLAAGRSCTTAPIVLSPDEQHLLYVADQDTDEQFELYSVPTDGSRVATKLSGTIPANADVLAGARWTPDGTRVVFGLNVGGLYSVLADGTQPPVQLTTMSPSKLEITADSALVVLLRSQLYSVRVDGSAPVRALSSWPQADFVTSFALASDGSKVVFGGTRFQGKLDSEDELFVVPSDGSGPAVSILGPFLNTTLHAPGVFQLTPDTTRAVYFSNQQQLYSVRVDGSEAGLLNPSSFPNIVSNWDVSPDGATVVFGAYSGGQSALLGVPTDHAAEALLLAGPGPAIFVIPAEAGIERAAFLWGRYLLSVPLDASMPAVVLADPVPGGIVQTFRLSPSAQRVVYLADQDVDDVLELYAVPLDGRTRPAKLNAPLVLGGDVVQFDFVPGSDLVVYRADQETDGVFELFMSRYKGFASVAGAASGPSGPPVVVPVH